MATSNLEIVQPTSSQRDKIPTIAEALEELDTVMTNREEITTTGDVTLTSDQALRNASLDFIGAAGADRDINCPVNEKLYYIRNSTTGGFTLTFQVTGGGGAGVILDTSDWKLVQVTAGGDVEELFVIPASFPIEYDGDFIAASLSGDDTGITSGDPVDFDTTDDNLGLSLSAGTVVGFKSGRTYAMLAFVEVVGGTSIEFQWKDNTAPAQIGFASTVLAGDRAAVYAIFQPSAVSVVELEGVTVTGGSDVGAANSHILIFEVGSFVPTTHKTISYEDATGTDNVSGFFTPVAITLQEVRAVIAGTSTPDIDINIQFHADRDEGSPSEVFTVDPTISSTGAGDTPAMNVTAIPANSWVWLITSAINGTVNFLSVFIHYTED